MAKFPFAHFHDACSVRTRRGNGPVVATAGSPRCCQFVRLPHDRAFAQMIRHWSALGPVLWLWREPFTTTADCSFVARWCSIQRISSCGVCEAVCLFARDGRECARLCLLPDSDYLAWEFLLKLAPCSTATASRDLHQHLHAAAWSRRGGPWQSAVVRFQPLVESAADWMLAVPVVSLSACGARHAGDICTSLDARSVHAAKPD